jgi:hypothetical protein
VKGRFSRVKSIKNRGTITNNSLYKLPAQKGDFSYEKLLFNKLYMNIDRRRVVATKQHD